jgi:FlaA1/EpsC-like NDP-sugar epimerase
MGEPVRIRDMAEQMIRFYGFEPEEDIKIEYVGLRPGERLDEKLWSADESPEETVYSRILRLRREERKEPDIEALTESLKPVCRFDPEQPEKYRNAALLRSILQEAIPSMKKGAETARECILPPQEIYALNN